MRNAAEFPHDSDERRPSGGAALVVRLAARSSVDALRCTFPAFARRRPPAMKSVFLPALFALATTSAHASDAKALTKKLQVSDRSTVADALVELGKLGRGGVAGLLVGTQHEEAWVRATAWRQLGDLGPAADGALGPACEKLVGTKRDPIHVLVGTRDVSAVAFASGFAQGVAGDGAFPKSKGEFAAQSERALERLMTISALADIGATSPTTFLSWIAKSEVSPSEGYHDLHAAFVIAVRKDKKKQHAILLDGLERAEPRVQAACLIGSYEIDEQVEEYTKRIEKRIGSTEPGVRGLAWAALISIAPNATVVREKAGAALTDPSAFVRVLVARSLALHGDSAQLEIATPVLEACASDESAFVRAAVIHTLEPDAMAAFRSKGADAGSTEPVLRAKVGVPLVSKALADKDPGVRLRAANALRAYGKDAKPAFGALKKLAKDEYEAVRDAAEATTRAVEKAAKG